MEISRDYQVGPLERLAIMFGGEGGKGTVCYASAIENYKKYLAELLGTFALIFVGSGCVCADYYLVKSGSQGFGLLGIAIAFGFVVVAVAYSLGYISGAHINPAVTISLVATRRIKAGVGGMYIVSQLAGATLAGFIDPPLMAPPTITPNSTTNPIANPANAGVDLLSITVAYTTNTNRNVITASITIACVTVTVEPSTHVPRNTLARASGNSIFNR